MESPKPLAQSSAYLPLGFTFIIPGIAMKGMIACVGVGAAFLFIHHNQ
ncbi:hypothetical protein [Spirosoma pomorum]